MKRNRIIVASLVVILTMGALVGCGSNAKPAANETTKTETQAQTQTQKKYADGTYFAEADNFDEKTGWKENVTLKVKDGKIVSVDWNGTNKNGGDDKKKQSKDGKYGMKKGGAKAEWHEEAEKVEAYLMEKQDPKDIKYKDDKVHTDAIAGATLKVNEFFTLAEKALQKGPTGK